MTLAGNLAGLREWLFVRRPQHQPLDWHYFWATSRVVRDTINEYPLWSLLFADLHAHVLSMPLLLLFLAQALQFVRVHADPSALPRTRLARGGGARRDRRRRGAHERLGRAAPRRASSR